MYHKSGRLWEAWEAFPQTFLYFHFCYEYFRRYTHTHTHKHTHTHTHWWFVFVCIIQDGSSAEYGRRGSQRVAQSKITLCVLWCSWLWFRCSCLIWQPLFVPQQLLLLREKAALLFLKKISNILCAIFQKSVPQNIYYVKLPWEDFSEGQAPR